MVRQGMVRNIMLCNGKGRYDDVLIFVVLIMVGESQAVFLT